MNDAGVLGPPLMRPLRLLVASCAWCAVHAALCAAENPASAAAPSAATAPAPVRPKQDAAGNPLRYAATGHVSNYDESKVPPYTLPDPLVLQSGEPVRDAATWTKKRRPEIMALYEREIYGRVPATAPKISFTVDSEETGALGGAATLRRIVGSFPASVTDAPSRAQTADATGANPAEARINVTLYLPPKATRAAPVPVFLHLQFFGGAQPVNAAGAATAGATAASSTNQAPAAKAAPARPRFSEDGPIADILARGYGYATVRYTQFEGDRADASLTLLRKLALAPGQANPAADEWGTIAAWAYGASRVLDFLGAQPEIDAQRAGIIGHSRLGKTVLWAGATDPRWAIVFSSCSGEMGAALARRDWGESVDDMAAGFPWQFAGNFQKYAGRWSDMPVDSHLLIALSAPRPVFITGGTTDQWADPKGEFLAEVAAGPVYRLLGKPDLGVSELPPLDTPVIGGTLGFHYHTGGHTITSADWKAFLDFADRHLPRPGHGG